MAEWTPSNDGKAAVYEADDAATVLRPVVTREAVTVAASTAALTINVAAHSFADVTLSANCTLTLTGARSGQAFTLTLVLRQDATGSREVTWPSGTLWNGGSAPNLTNTANHIDVVTLTSADGGSTWFGVEVGLAFA